MKKRLLGLTLITLLCLGKANAQETNGSKASVEESVTGLQISPLGAWAYHEFKLSDEFALRAEAGINASIWGGSQYDGINYIFAPAISVEPRWYYNLKKRVDKGRNIKGNSANFLSLKINYMPDWFVLNANSDYTWNGYQVVDYNINNEMSIVPTWGIRRALGKYFDYEAGFGLGYGYRFTYKENGYTIKGNGRIATNAHLRIGFHF